MRNSFRNKPDFVRETCTNLAEHIEDGTIAGAVFVDLSAAYDTVNHRRLLSKVLEMTGDVHLTYMIRTMLESRRFFMVVNGKKSRWRRHQNGLPQRSVLTQMLFIIYILHQRPARTRRHSQLRVARKRLQQHRSVTHVCLSTMTTYYDTNQLREYPSKTQVCAFQPMNREAKRELNVVWNGTRLSNTTTPVYLGVHLDRTLCYKTHIEKTKMKVNTRNNIIRKLANSKWECNASTLIPSCLALCYSAAEYACPVLTRSTHAHKLYARLLPNHLGLHQTNELEQCTPTVLACIAPPHIRMTAACRMERTRQTTDARHQLSHHRPAASRLKSRKSLSRPTRLRSAADCGSGKTA